MDPVMRYGRRLGNRELVTLLSVGLYDNSRVERKTVVSQTYF